MTVLVVVTMSLTFAWVYSRHAWFIHSDFRRVSVPSSTRSEEEVSGCYDGARIGSLRKRKEFGKGFMWLPPSSKWPAVEPFYHVCTFHTCRRHLLNSVRKRGIILTWDLFTQGKDIQRPYSPTLQQQRYIGQNTSNLFSCKLQMWSKNLPFWGNRKMVF